MVKIMFMVLLASLCSGMIEHTTHHPKVECLCPAIGNGKNNVYDAVGQWHYGVIEPLTHHPKFEFSHREWQTNVYGTVGQWS
jgi:hypothetical protein